MSICTHTHTPRTNNKIRTTVIFKNPDRAGISHFLDLKVWKGPLASVAVRSDNPQGCQWVGKTVWRAELSRWVWLPSRGHDQIHFLCQLKN